jgi:hypothetical protein
MANFDDQNQRGRLNRLAAVIGDGLKLMQDVKVGIPSLLGNKRGPHGHYLGRLHLENAEKWPRLRGH